MRLARSYTFFCDSDHSTARIIFLKLITTTGGLPSGFFRLFWLESSCEVSAKQGAYENLDLAAGITCLPVDATVYRDDCWTFLFNLLASFFSLSEP